MSKGDGDGLNIREAAEQLGVSPRTVRRWIRDGKIQAAKVPGPYGPEWRIPAEAVSTAQHVIDVVRVERPNEPEALALAVSRALQERDARLFAALHDEFQKKFDALQEQLREQAAALEARDEARWQREEERDRKLLEAIREAQERRRRPWWRFW